MARKRKPTEAKLRTREHIVADLAVNHFERQALLEGFAVDRTQQDYGIDLRLLTFTSQGEAEPGAISVQMKGTDSIRIMQNGAAVAWRIERSDLLVWLHELLPVILVMYDAQADVAYWLHMQGYFASLPGFNLFSAGATITVYLPIGQVLTPGAIRGFATLRDQATPASS